MSVNRHLTRIRHTLSPLSTERLRDLWKLLAAELPRLRGVDRNYFAQIAEIAAEILESRASGEASSRLLGGAA